jgi:TonB family protein
MNTIVIYMVKVAVFITAFYAVYSLLLSRDTTYSRNRAFIILSLITAFIFPLINLHTAKPLNIQLFGKMLSEAFVKADASSTGSQASGLTIAGILQNTYSIYLIVVFIFILKLVADLGNLFILIIRHKNEGSRIIRFHGFSTSGFSAMGYIFINTRLSPEDAGEIIRHEQNHLRQNHFIDIIFIEIVKAIQWFNPTVYLFNGSLRAIHEYQADQDCLSSGVPITNYQSLLLSQIFKSKAFSLSNSFSNPSLLKKRMLMMTKERTTAIANMKLLVVVPIITLVFLAVSAYREIPASPAKEIRNSASFDYGTLLPPPPPPPPPAETVKAKVEKSEEEYIPFVVVEEMPMFPGGDKALLDFIGANTIYPESAKTQNIQGKVIVRFCVGPKGDVALVSVIKGVSPELDAEAIRVVNTLPEFKPGKQGGKTVPVWYMVPIAFTLQ